jgi:hypothetical protein
MAVQNELGNAFLEPVYQEALALELGKRKIPLEREPRLTINTKMQFWIRSMLQTSSAKDGLLLSSRCAGVLPPSILPKH